MTFSEMEKFLRDIGLKQNQHVMIHAAYRKIRREFPGLNIEDFLRIIQDIITPEGSVILATFSYCFAKVNEPSKIYNPDETPSKVGAVSEVFRKMPEVIRTASATHSFALWGRASGEIQPDNAPESPLGEGSVLEWLSRQQDAFILMLGTDFLSLSFCHYLETMAPVPWHDTFPWAYLGIRPAGVSIKGEQELHEVPGCSKSFVNFENYLLNRKIIHPFRYHSLFGYFIHVGLLLEHGLSFFRSRPLELLCPKNQCSACDSRRQNKIKK